jgi:hypothetical protein
MYTQAAAHSTADVANPAGQYNQGHKPSDQWLQSTQSSSKRSKWIVCIICLCLVLILES